MHRLFSEPMLAVWGLLGTALGTLLILALTLWAGRQFARQARELWRTLRGRHDEIVHSVDEPTDPVIVQLERVSRVPAAVWAAFLPAFLNALAAGLDRALADSPENEPG